MINSMPNNTPCWVCPSKICQGTPDVLEENPQLLQFSSCQWLGNGCHPCERMIVPSMRSQVHSSHSIKGLSWLLLYCGAIQGGQITMLAQWLSTLEWRKKSPETNLLVASLFDARIRSSLYTSVTTVYEFVWYPPSTSEWQDYNLFVKEIRFNQPSLGGGITLKYNNIPLVLQLPKDRKRLHSPSNSRQPLTEQTPSTNQPGAEGVQIWN